MVGERPRRLVVRLAAQQAVGSSRWHRGVPRARRRVAVRQGTEQGNGVDHRRTAALQLRAAADEQGRVRLTGHGGSARRPVVLHLRRCPEQSGAADARRGAGANQRADPRSRPGAAGGGRAGVGYPRPRRVRGRPPGRQHQRRPRRPVRDVGRHRVDPRATDRHHRRPWT